MSYVFDGEEEEFRVEKLLGHNYCGCGQLVFLEVINLFSKFRRAQGYCFHMMVRCIESLSRRKCEAVRNNNGLSRR